MDDGFLHQFRESPSEEFALHLYQDLILQEAVHDKGRAIPAIAAFLLILLAVTSMVAFVPDARAKLIDIIEDVAGISFLMTSDYPGDGNVTIVPSQQMALEEAQSILPYELPTWIPDGFQIKRTVDVTRFAASGVVHISVMWTKAAEIIQLAVVGGATSTVVGPESVEKLEVNGREVAIWQGGWNWDTKEWDPHIAGMTISWGADGIVYHLNAFGSEVTMEELLRMAGSMP